MRNLYNIPVSEISVGELVDILKGISVAEEKKPKIEKKYVYGLDGLARLLGCSKTHALKVKNSGIITPAIIQNGRKIIIDSELALNLFNKHYV